MTPRIYTKTGDDGRTALFGGGRVQKDDLRVEAYGDVDELNAVIGAARSADLTPRIDEVLAPIQRDLFAIGALLATPHPEEHRKQLEKARLTDRRITQLVVTGVTTEVCVHTTVREANDRGFDCLVPGDCVGSYFPAFHTAALAMIKAQGGIFGWVSASKHVLAAMDSH